MAITITKPTVGGNEDTWGSTINTALDTIVNSVNGTSGTVAPNLSTLTINGTDVTSTAAELNKLDGFSGTFEDLNYAKDLRATGVTSTEFGYLDTVSSNIQTQLNAKQATITGGATTIDTEDLTASRVLVSNSSGKVAVSSVTSTELSKLDGFTGTYEDLNYAKDLRATGVTTTEFDKLDGSTSRVSITWADADGIVMNDNGTMTQATAQSLKTYVLADVTSPNNATITISAGTGLTTGGTFTTNQGTAGTITLDLTGDQRLAAATDVYVGNQHEHIHFNDGSQHIEFMTGGAEEMRLENDGDLHVDGNITAYSTTVSDQRLKHDIQKIDGALDKVSQLSGYTFSYNKDGKRSAGVIAQEVENVLPSAVENKTLVFHGQEGIEYKTVQYDQLHGLLIEAIKELKAEIEVLKNDASK